MCAVEMAKIVIMIMNGLWESNNRMGQMCLYHCCLLFAFEMDLFLFSVVIEVRIRLFFPFFAASVWPKMDNATHILLILLISFLFLVRLVCMHSQPIEWQRRSSVHLCHTTSIALSLLLSLGCSFALAFRTHSESIGNETKEV